jgi:hypothetical protein
VLTNLKLSLPEIGVTERFPATLADLYHGQQLISAGKFDEARTGPIKITAMRNGKTVEYAWPGVSFTNTAEARYVPAIWAGRKISFLIDQIRAHGENKEMIEEIIALSQEYGIQTPYSSWLVNPDQPVTIAGRTVRLVVPGAPGRGGGGGVGGSSRSSAQGDALRAAGARVSEPPITVTVEEAEAMRQAQYVHTASGEAATMIAKRNALMREQRNKDEGGRLNQSLLAQQKINSQWYNRIGQFLVDERLTEETPILTVKFGSDAYFALVNGRAHLRSALAASRNVVVMATESQAVMVIEDGGIEALSPEQVQQVGLGGRN